MAIDGRLNGKIFLLDICCINVYFGDTLTCYNIPLGVNSCNLSFIFDRPVIYKTSDYIDNWTTALGVYLVLISIICLSLIGRLKM